MFTVLIGELSARQVCALRQEGLSAEDISVSLGIELPQVKLVLAQNEPGADRDINDDELAILRKHAFNLALSAEDQTIQARMTMFLIERDKPKKETEKASPITMINNAIINATANYQEMLKSYSGPLAENK